MKHDDLTEMLRNLPAPSIGGVPLGGVHMAAANLLDRYRELLERALPQLDDKWQDEADLIAEIKASINQ